MNKNKKSIVILLGMHRSGTSALARGMQVLGRHLGENLIEGSIPNPKGYWEDAEINAFNERLMSELSTSWNSLTIYDRLLFSDPKLEPFKVKANAILKSRFAKFPMFSFKDPRTAVLLPFWQEIFQQQNQED